MNLTPEIIAAGTGCRSSLATVWCAPLQLACTRFGILTREAIAAFLANIGVESEELTVLVENLNYSAQELANTWPQRFATVAKAVRYTPNALALSLAYKPQQIANYVYANRMGNGDVTSGDGWKYRGQGPFQITGKQQMQWMGAVLGLDLVNHPELLQSPAPGALSAALFFSSRGCIIAAENNNFSQVVRLINGAAPDAANQGPLREARYKAALNALPAETITSALPTSGPLSPCESPTILKPAPPSGAIG
jgi:putative chitinase